MQAKQRPSEQEVEIARVYAQALLSLAAARRESEPVHLELEEFIELLDRQPALDRYLASPLVDTGERRVRLDRMLQGRMSDLLLDTFQVMNRKGRSNLVRALAVAYREEFEEKEGIVEVHVRTAVPLTEEAESRLREVAAGFTGKRVRLAATIDEDLIGGMVVHVGDRRIDTSVAKELRHLRMNLRERATREIHGSMARLESRG